MEKKTMTIIAVVAVVAIVAIVAAVVLMNNNSKEYNAQELAQKFVDDYDGEFGDFTIATGGSPTEAEMKYVATQKNWKGEDLSATRAMNIKIVTCESKEKAAQEFEKYISVADAPYNSKNGSTAGNTILNKLDKLGMAADYVTVLNGTKNIDITTIPDNTTLKTVKASDYGADQIYVLYAAYHKTDDATKQQYSQFAMVLLDGKNIVVINQSSKDEFSMYYNISINEKSKAKEGEAFITVEDFEKELIKFAKAF